MAPQKRIRRMFENIKKGVSGLKNKLGADRVSMIDQKVKPPSKIKPPVETLVKFDMFNVAKVVLVILLLLVAAMFVYQIRVILLILFIAYLLAAALIPTVDWLYKFKIPRGLSVIVIYMLALAVLVFFLSSFLPILGRELAGVAGNIQNFVFDLNKGDVSVPWLNYIMQPVQQYVTDLDISVLFVDVQKYLTDIARQLTSLAGNAVAVLVAFSNGVFNLFLILVLSFYFIVERESVQKFIVSLFPSRYEKYIRVKNEALQVKIGYWLRGQFLLMLSIAALTYIALLVLGVNYALTLAVLAGLMELLPVVGPFIAFLGAVPIVANQSMLLLLVVFIVFFVIQQLENNVIVPVIMKKTVGISSIFVIVSMLIGGSYLGILGVILSIPVASIIGIFLTDYVNREGR